MSKHEEKLPKANQTVKDWQKAEPDTIDDETGKPIGKESADRVAKTLEEIGRAHV